MPETNWEQPRPAVDREGGTWTACPEVLQRLEDRRSAHTYQPTDGALDYPKGRETFYQHNVLCLVSLDSDLLGLTQFSFVNSVTQWQVIVTGRFQYICVWYTAFCGIIRTITLLVCVFSRVPLSYRAIRLRILQHTVYVCNQYRVHCICTIISDIA